MPLSEISSVFDELQAVYTQKMIGWVPFYQENIEKMLPSFPASEKSLQFLDLGTGNGNVAALMLQNHPSAHLTLVDASEKMLQACQERFRKYNRIKYELALMQDLTLPTDHYDLITASFSLHHIDHPRKAKVIELIHRWLKPGGYFSYLDLFIDHRDANYHDLVAYWQEFVVAKVGREEWNELFDHHQKYDIPCNLSDAMKWIQEAGFQEVLVTIKDKYWLRIWAIA